MQHLGRSKGHPIPSIFQKYLTGHPKGAAAAWMLNGALQVLETGIIPGNRNADNIAAELREFDYILYPSRSIHTDGVKAGLLKSFGFGQVGGEVLIIHPEYVFATLDEHVYVDYCKRNHARQAKAYRYWHDALTGVKPLVQLKNAPPYSTVQESQVYLNPLARASYNKVQQTWGFQPNSVHQSIQLGGDSVDVTRHVLASITNDHEWTGVGVGVDVELHSAIPMDSETFMERNFTPQEHAYCMSRPDPLASFAGRWSAKEAIVKALSSLDQTVVWTKGAGAPLKDVEVLSSVSGVPVVVLHGEAKRVAEMVGVKEVKVTISHAGSYAVAVAVAK
jgi:fatty acid synthase subunit beta